MARFNKAKNFAGKSYVISSDMESLIQSLKASTAEGKDYTLQFGGFDASGDAVISKEINLSAWFEKIKGDIAGEAVGIEAGNGVRLKARTSEEDGKSITTIRAIGSEIVTLAPATTVTTGYAATYDFTVVTGYEEDGTPIKSTTKIDIVKDQFLKKASVVWSTQENLQEGAIVGESDNKTETAIYPFLKMEMYSNTNGVNTDDVLVTTVYIPVSEMFKDYKAGAAIEIDGTTINVLVDSSKSIYTSKGAQDSAIKINEQNKIQIVGVQSAIDLAADNVWEKADAAISSVNTKTEAFESDVNSKVKSAVGSVNTMVSSTVTNVNTQVTSAVTSVNTQVAAVVSAVKQDVASTVSNVNTQVAAVVSAVKSDITSTVSNVNTQVSAVVSAVKQDVESTVSNVNTQVSAVVSAVKQDVASTVDNVNTQVSAVVSAVKQDVTSTVSNVNTQVAAVVSAVKQDITSTVTNVNTQVSAVVSAVKQDVTSTVSNVNTQVSAAVSAVNTQMSGMASSIFVLTETSPTVTLDANGIATASMDDCRIVAVYDNNGAQIYPEITRQNVDGVVKNTLTADYGSGYASAITWNILHTAPYSSFTAASYTNADAVTAATYTNADVVADATYTNASAVTAASYTDASVVADATYEDAEAVKNAVYSNANVVSNATYSNAAYSNAVKAADAAYTDANFDDSTEMEELDYKQA